ncbi:MAG TPA: hypothetical protein VK901_12660 [Nitrospiraceae bacterium]|nr:hypothetical protein [Nitrospiraceae bacterium]
MIVYPHLRREFLSYPSALLILLVLLSSACGHKRGPLDNTPSMDVGNAKESRTAVSNLNVNRSIRYGKQSELKGSLKQIILEGYTLKVGIEKEYRSYRGEKNFEVHAQDLTRGWSLKVAKWAENAGDVLQEIDFVAKQQFQGYHGPIVQRGAGDEKWGTIDNWLSDKLAFLERLHDNFGTR